VPPLVVLPLVPFPVPLVPLVPLVPAGLLAPVGLLAPFSWAAEVLPELPPPPPPQAASARDSVESRSSRDFISLQAMR
jgi:hypothetical protein